MATLVKGRSRLMSQATVASTLYTIGDLIAYAASEANTVVLATSTTDKHLGVCQTSKLAADTSTDPILIEVPRDLGCEFEIATASSVVTDVGGYFDLTDAVTVNRGATANDAVLQVGFLSATLGRYFLPSFVGSHSETYP